MATTKEYHDYVMEQLSRAGNFSSKKMMGEYCLYLNGKLFGGIYDNELLIKPFDEVLKLLPDAGRRYPYEGSKSLMVIIDELDNIELLEKLVKVLEAV